MKKYIFIFFVIIGFLIVKENIKKATGIYNHFYNIMRLFDDLPNFPFTTSETMCDYYL